MAQRSDEIKRHIERTRSQLGENVQEIEDRVRTATDWRAHFRSHPALAAGIAFGGGFLLSWLTVHSKSAH